MIKQCKTCGKEFEYNHGNKKYCCASCREQATRLKYGTLIENNITRLTGSRNDKMPSGIIAYTTNSTRDQQPVAGYMVVLITVRLMIVFVSE